MPYHIDNALAAAEKALSQAVRPSLDRSDPLAIEQLDLVVALLGFLRTRVPLLERRSLREAEAYRGMAERIIGSGVTLPERLAAAVRDAAGCKAESEAIAAAAAAFSDVARLSTTMPESSRCAIERAIVAASADMVELGRSWFEPFGFDRNPVTPLGTLLEQKDASR